VYLLRHADANTEAATDDARPLSQKGISQARKVGRFCKDHNLKPDVIITSPVRSISVEPSARATEVM